MVSNVDDYLTSGEHSSINHAGIPGVAIPTGGLMPFGGVAAPSGWLVCDGTSYTTASQPALFAAIGYLWGGAGPNFNVPNMSRRTVVGSGGAATGTLGNTVGNLGGAETHTLITTELASHTHGVTDPGHFHIQYHGNTAGLYPASGYSNASSQPTSTATTGITINNAGASGAHNNMQPSAVVLWIIKT